jgi:diguanylate cyclase (GGDEF)-like protein
MNSWLGARFDTPQWNERSRACFLRYCRTVGSSQTKTLPAFTAGCVALIGIGVLAGWAFNIEPLMTVLPGLIRMKSNSAVAFVFSALALYLAYKNKLKPLQAVCAVGIALLGALTLCEYLWGVNMGIDEFLFRDAVQSPYPGRMAQFTASAFVLTGIFLYPFRFRANEKLTDVLALLVGFASTLAVVGYLYGVPVLYGSIRYTAMAIHTGIAFLLLSVGFLHVEKAHGFARVFRAQTAGGLLARSLVPPAILIPIVVGAIFVRFNFGQLRLGIAFIVMCNIVLVVASIWGLARVLDRSEIARHTARHDSEFDALTEIHNRRYFDRRLAEEIQRCVRHHRASSLILFDIDHFKNLNDRFGHLAGDRVLQTIAHACESAVRGTDVICRFGGEEFAVIAPETRGEDAMILCEKLRTLVEQLTFENVPIQVTISLGAAEVGGGISNAERAIAAADQGLYTAKRSGRNRQCLFAEQPEAEPAGIR